MKQARALTSLFRPLIYCPHVFQVEPRLHESGQTLLTPVVQLLGLFISLSFLNRLYTLLKPVNYSSFFKCSWLYLIDREGSGSAHQAGADTAKRVCRLQAGQPTLARPALLHRVSGGEVGLLQHVVHAAVGPIVIHRPDLQQVCSTGDRHAWALMWGSFSV